MGTAYNLIFDDRRILPDNTFDEEHKTPMSDDFKHISKSNDYDMESIHMFILSDGKTYPIHKKSKYYIMTEKGNTFQSIKTFI